MYVMAHVVKVVETVCHHRSSMGQDESIPAQMVTYNDGCVVLVCPGGSYPSKKHTEVLYDPKYERRGKGESDGREEYKEE